MSNYLSSRVFQTVSVGAGAGAVKTKLLSNGDILDCAECIGSLVILDTADQTDGKVTLKNLVLGAKIYIAIINTGNIQIDPGEGISIGVSGIYEPSTLISWVSAGGDSKLALLTVIDNNTAIIGRIQVKS